MRSDGEGRHVVGVCIRGEGRLLIDADREMGTGHASWDGDPGSTEDGYVGIENDNEDTGHQPAVVACRSGDYRNDEDEDYEPWEGNHVIIGGDLQVTAPYDDCLR